MHNLSLFVFRRQRREKKEGEEKMKSRVLEERRKT